jgi:hypothetical protein
MTTEEIAQKIREHLGKAKSSALMMANAHSALDRNRYLQKLSVEFKAAVALLDKLPKTDG